MAVSLKRLTTKIATKAGPKVGFEPLLITGIITGFIQLFAACKKKESPDTTPAEFLAAHYDASNDTFDVRLVRRARANTRKSARKEGQKGLSAQQLDELTIAAFREGMNEKDQEGLKSALDAVAGE